MSSVIIGWGVGVTRGSCASQVHVSEDSTEEGDRQEDNLTAVLQPVSQEQPPQGDEGKSAQRLHDPGA